MVCAVEFERPLGHLLDTAAIETLRQTRLISGIAAGVTLRLRSPMPNSSIV